MPLAERQMAVESTKFYFFVLSNICPNVSRAAMYEAAPQRLHTKNSYALLGWPYVPNTGASAQIPLERESCEQPNYRRNHFHDTLLLHATS